MTRPAALNGFVAFASLLAGAAACVGPSECASHEDCIVGELCEFSTGGCEPPNLIGA